MSTVRMSFARRSVYTGRGALVALVAGAGVALTPLPALAGSGPGPAAVAAAPALTTDHTAQVAVETALAQQGKPYGWGAAGPGSFDCSGLVNYSYQAAGVALPRTSRALSTMGTPVAKADLRPGDLVFFYSPVSHVGIYIGNGQMVHASTYGRPVIVTSVDMAGYVGARRLSV